MKIITPILLLLITGLVLVAYVDPTYAHIRELSAEETRFNDALTRSKELIRVRDDLIARRNAFEPNDQRRLGILLPNNVDNVRLIMDIDSIASRYGMSVQSIDIEDASTGQKDTGGIGPDSNPIGSINLSFSVSTTYANFISFLKDLEQSLRIIDVRNVSFVAGETDFNQYTIGIRTYWLK